MNDCNCAYCYTQPKNAEQDENCLVLQLRVYCESSFPGWSFVDSFNAQTEESGLCIVKYLDKFDGLTDIQKSNLENAGYKILDIHTYSVNGEDDFDIDHQDGNDFCQCDTCTGTAVEQVKVVIDVERCPAK